MKSDSHNVASRQQAIASTYEKLVQAAEVCVCMLVWIQICMYALCVHAWVWFCVCSMHFPLDTLHPSILQLRRTKLDDTIRQFGLFRECDEVESWIKEKVCSYAWWSFVLVHNMRASSRTLSLPCMVLFVTGDHHGSRGERWCKGEGGSHAEEVWRKSHCCNICLPC